MSPRNLDYDVTPCCHDGQRYEGKCHTVLTMGHEWSHHDLACRRVGCGVNWFDHQEAPAVCIGGRSQRQPREITGKAQQYIAQARRRRVALPLYHLYGWKVREINDLFPEVSEVTIRRDIKGRKDNVGKKGRPPDRAQVLGDEPEPGTWAPMSKPRVGRDRASDPSRACEVRSGDANAAR